MGWWAAGASCALAAGPLLGGVLIAAAGWRAIFLINLPLGALAIALTIRHVHETPRHPAHGLDLLGQLTAMLALGLLAAATIEAGAVGFAPLVIAGYAAGALCAIAFVGIEARARRPMLPLGFFRQGVFAAASAIGLLINISVYGLIFVFSLVLQRHDGLSPLKAGLAFLPMTVAVGVANVAAGRLAGRRAARTLIGAGLATMALGCALLWLGTAHGSAVVLALVLIVLGAGAGVVVPVLTTAMMGSVDRRHSGVAAATLNSMRQTGSVLGVALFGALIAGRGHLLSGTNLALAISIAVLAAAGVATGRVRV